MTHFVYPYIIPDDPKLGWELLYSIRSIHKHFKGDFDITIIGQIPDWINTTQCLCIKYENEHIPNKQVRVTDKVYLASLLYEEFVSMNDDFYIMQDITLDDIKDKRYYKRYSDDFLKEYNPENNNGYKNTVVRTLEECAKLNTDHNYNYATHTPTFYTRANLLKLKQSVNVFDLKHGFILNVLYNNIFLTDHYINTPDHKYGVYNNKHVEFTNRYKFFNHDNNGFLYNIEILSYLGSNFNIKTKTEK